MNEDINEEVLEENLDEENELDTEEDTEEQDLESRRPQGFTGKIITNPVKAIRQNCLECCCGNRAEVKECTAYNCACWPFRLGKNPYRTRVFTEEQRQAIRERMIKRNTKA